MMEKCDAPLVSVVMTVRNAEAFIAETLRSILQERTIPLEIVLIDNGCSDTTIDQAVALQDDRIRIIKGPGKGIAHALNVAYAAVRGEIVMRCDGDDLFAPERITRQVEWFKNHPEFGAMCGGFATIDSKGNPLANMACEDSAREVTEELRNGSIRTHIGTYAIRTNVIRAAGGSREYFDCFEDFDFQLRVGETCRVWFTPEVQFLYRLHENSSTHSTSNAKKSFYDSVAFEFQRQRQTSGMDDLQRGCPPELPAEGFFSAKTNTANHIQGLLIYGAWADHRAGNKKLALAKGIRSVVTKPTNWEAWITLLALAIKPSGEKQIAASAETSKLGSQA